jgi:hypothetical protein
MGPGFLQQLLGNLQITIQGHGLGSVQHHQAYGFPIEVGQAHFIKGDLLLPLYDFYRYGLGKMFIEMPFGGYLDLFQNFLNFVFGMVEEGNHPVLKNINEFPFSIVQIEFIAIGK